jgi:plastocyanin
MQLRTQRATILAAIAVAMTACFAACGGDDSSGPGDDGTFTGTIHIQDDHFSPSSVTISVGDSVTWRWEGSHPHTVTQGTSPTNPMVKLFDTPQKTSGTFGFRFTNAATVQYFCRVHAGMTGSIKVNP